MRREEDAEENALILCVNHACASNGGTNCEAIATSATAENDKLRAALVRIADGASQPIDRDHPSALIRCEIETIAREALAG